MAPPPGGGTAATAPPGPSASACREEGGRLFRAGQVEQALREWSMGIAVGRLSPDLPLLYANRAAAYLALGKSSFAVGDVRGALFHGPPFPRPRGLRRLRLYKTNCSPSSPHRLSRRCG